MQRLSASRGRHRVNETSIRGCQENDVRCGPACGHLIREETIFHNADCSAPMQDVPIRRHKSLWL
jgi:hypothetical protein